MQPHFPLWGGLYSVCCHASGQCLQRGKVMGVRYPGLVSRHNLVCPLLLWYLVPVWTGDCFAAMVAVGCHWLTSGAPMTYPRWELVVLAERVSCQWVGSVGMPLVHPNGSVRPWVLWCGYSVLTPAECVFVKSIDSRPRG